MAFSFLRPQRRYPEGARVPGAVRARLLPVSSWGLRGTQPRGLGRGLLPSTAMGLVGAGVRPFGALGEGFGAFARC